MTLYVDPNSTRKVDYDGPFDCINCSKEFEDGEVVFVCLDDDAIQNGYVCDNCLTGMPIVTEKILDKR